MGQERKFAFAIRRATGKNYFYLCSCCVCCCVVIGFVDKRAIWVSFLHWFSCQKIKVRILTDWLTSQEIGRNFLFLVPVDTLESANSGNFSQQLWDRFFQFVLFLVIVKNEQQALALFQSEKFSEKFNAKQTSSSFYVLSNSKIFSRWPN